MDGANTSEAGDEEQSAEAEPTPSPEAAAPAESTAEASGPFSEEVTRAAELELENAALKDRVLRLAAEMENLRRRTEKDVRDAGQFGITKFARDMLAIGDNLKRALDAVPTEAREAADPGLLALLEGVEMTERELINGLARHGITPIDPEGEKFDPNAHEAVFQVPDESVPAGTVSQVVQTGFRIGERVLRPAMVGVTAGGPKQAPAESAPETETPPGSTVDRTA